MADLAQRLTDVRQRIREAERRYGRPPGAVALIAVSKTQPVDAIRAAAGLGQRAFAENYLQEALEKIAALEALGLEWHFIGHVQSNKCRDIARHFDWVHSVDRSKTAQRLSEHRPAQRGALNVCLQVNIEGEATKGGVDPDALEPLARAVSAMPHLRLRGLMAIPAPSPDFDAQRAVFRRLRAAQQRLQARGFRLDTLSMGMSADIEAAIAEGSTHVRVGTAVFGARPPRAGADERRAAAHAGAAEPASG